MPVEKFFAFLDFGTKIFILQQALKSGFSPSPLPALKVRGLMKIKKL
jgi:hypothetical protein